jgi:nucleotide-binding universal stress UspA family protein
MCQIAHETQCRLNEGEHTLFPMALKFGLLTDKGIHFAIDLFQLRNRFFLAKATEECPMKVLVGVDGSNGSNAAVQFIGRLLSPETDQLTMFYTPPKLDLTAKSRQDPQLTKRLEGFLCEAVFSAAKKQLPPALSQHLTTVVGTQSATHGILVAADEYRADLVVVGSRGTGRMKDLDIGGTARAVVHHATLPVLVVRPVSEQAGSHPLRVLLASSCSEINTQACELLKHFKWPPDTVARLVTVVESPFAGHIPDWLEEELRNQEIDALGLGYFEHQEEECRRAREEAIRGYDQLPAMFQRTEPIVSVGHPSEEIVKTITSEQIDLVIVGARSFGRVKRLLLGSTAEYLLAHAPCSVLVARHHEKP